jgi:hypothetical protein
MKKTIFLFAILAFGARINAQFEVKFIGSIEDKYTFPLTSIDSHDTKGIVRYSSSFTNFVGKTHFKFNPSFAASINLGILNQGFIHRFGDTMTVKQRAYILPIGVQLTFGDVSNKNFFVGGEVQLPFHYKQKVFLKGEKKDTKVKSNEWMGSQVEMFSPAVFLGVQYKKDRYVQIKYHLGNFLNPNYNFNFRGNTVRFNESSFIELSFAGVFNFSSIRSGGLDQNKPEMDLDL